MTRYVPLNPFENIVQKLNTFLQTHHATLSTLMLREYEGKPEQRLREMNISKVILEETRYVGIININIINEKFAASNLKTTKERRFPNVDNAAHEVNSDWFKQEYNDPREQLKIQLSFKQFRTDNLGICDVSYSTRVVVFPAEANPWETARLTREDTAHLWNDPAMVLAIRQFYAIVEPVLDAWTPAIGDITTQTVFIK